MKKNIKIWSVALILLGTMNIICSLNIINEDLFFKGFWSLFIIIPSIISMVITEEKKSNLIMMIFGFIFFLIEKDILLDTLAFQLITSLLGITSGLIILIKTIKEKNNQEQ